MKQMEALVLAAGYSSRAHDFKMTLKLGELTVLEHTFSKFEGICNKVIIVGGYQWEKIHEEVLRIQTKNRYSMKIHAVFNEQFDKGMFSSIQKGCREIHAHSFFVTPGDYPVVNKRTLQNLAANRNHVVIPSYRNKGGHPIKLSKEVKMKIMEAEASCNLRKILEDYDKCYENVGDPGILMDIDTPEDYKRVNHYYKELEKATDHHYIHKSNKTE